MAIQDVLEPQLVRLRARYAKTPLPRFFAWWGGELLSFLPAPWRAALAEGRESLLLHVADASDPMVDERIESVEKILAQTGYESIPQMIVLNKADKTPSDVARRLGRVYSAPLISAREKDAIPEMLELIEKRIFGETPEDEAEGRMALSLHTA